jgi:hypothetical protein
MGGMCNSGSCTWVDGRIVQQWELYIGGWEDCATVGVVHRWMGGLCNSGFVEEKGNAHGDLMENLKERDHLEDIEVDGSIVLKWILKKCEWNM